MLYSNGAGIINPACYGGSEGPYYWKHKFDNELVVNSQYRCTDSLATASYHQVGASQTFSRDPDVIIIELYGSRTDSSGTISYIRARLRDPDHIVWDKYYEIGTRTDSMTLLATQRAVVEQTSAQKGVAYFVLTLESATGVQNEFRFGCSSGGTFVVSSALTKPPVLPAGATYYYEGVIWYGFDYQRVYDLVRGAIEESENQIKALQNELDAINNDIQNKFVCR